MLKIFFILFLLRFIKSDENNLESYRQLDSFVELKGGEFVMGINDRDGVNFEYPSKKAIVEPFRIMIYPVSNAAFMKFKNEKRKHRTDAEKSGSSWVFKPLMDSNAVVDKTKDINHHESEEALKMKLLPVLNAKWINPEGGDSKINERLDYPVVHVSYNDAFAYCAWKGMRLPSEIEWEFAARGGLKEKLYPWGDKWEVGRTNLWQGKFPEENQMRDGHYGLSPVTAFKAQNEYEMFDVIGNVWEWTSTIYRSPYKPDADVSNRRVLKGGSFMDTRDSKTKEDKMKIRISTRIGREQTYTAQNVGFRCVQSIKKTDKTNFGDSKFKVVHLRAPKVFMPTIHQEL